MEKAYHLCRSGRPGPVWIDIPANIQNAFINEKKLRGFKITNKSKQILHNSMVMHSCI